MIIIYEPANEYSDLWISLFLTSSFPQAEKVLLLPCSIWPNSLQNQASLNPDTTFPLQRKWREEVQLFLHDQSSEMSLQEQSSRFSPLYAENKHFELLEFAGCDLPLFSNSWKSFR